MFQAAFIAVAAVGLCQFLVLRRRLDAFSLAFFSALVYFLPGFVGVVRSGHSLVATDPIADETYVIFISVILSICIAGFLASRGAAQASIRDTNAPWPNSAYVAHAALALSMLGCVGSLLTTGQALFVADKAELLDALNHWHILWEVAGAFALVLGFLARSRSVALGAATLLLFDLVVGFRSAAALAVIALAFVWMTDKGPLSLLLDRARVLAVGLVGATFFFVYKQLYVLVKLGLFDEVGQKLFDTELYLIAVTRSEPFTTQAVLNEIVINKHYVGFEHWAPLPSLLVPGGLLFGVEIDSFNSLFQSTLFAPDIFGGVANNIWGQMMSSGGWITLYCFVAIYCLLLWVFNKWAMGRSPLTRATAVLTLVTWAFYIHRNDLAYQLTLSRRFLFVALLLLIVSAGLETLRRSRVETAAKGSISESIVA